MSTKFIAGLYIVALVCCMVGWALVLLHAPSIGMVALFLGFFATLAGLLAMLAGD